MKHHPPCGFIVAMSARITISEYERPMRPQQVLERWLIVSRWGPHAELITISTVCDEPGSHPYSTAESKALTPEDTLVGVQSSKVENAANFLLLRRPPPTMIAGRFLSAEGYARLSFDGANFLLFAEGRDALEANNIGPPAPLPGSSEPLERSLEGAAWRIEATQRAWKGEFLPGLTNPFFGGEKATPLRASLH